MTRRFTFTLANSKPWELSLLAGVGCLVVMLLLMLFEPGSVLHLRPAQAFNAWLFGWIVWFGVSLGSMGVVMMHHLLGGRWGYPIRRLAEHAGACVPFMAILFVPVLLGAPYLYPWADTSAVAHDAVLRHKAGYLNWPFWALRGMGILAVFAAMTWRLRSRSLLADRNRPQELLESLRIFSAPGQVLYFALMSMASVDWIMSRDPHWYSTVFAFIVIVSQAVSALCVLILLAAIFQDREPMKKLIDANALNDLATVLLVFVVLWAYLSFAQLLVVWLGNEQTEITWYIRRTDGGWWWVGAALILLHFVVPFILLLLRPIKRNLNRLAAVAALVLVMRAVDVLYWLLPGDLRSPFATLSHAIYGEFYNLLGLVAVGGFWLGCFLWLMRDGPLVAVHEIQEFTGVHPHDQRQPTI